MRKIKKSQIKEVVSFLESAGYEVKRSRLDKKKYVLPRYAFIYLESKEKGNFYKSPVYKIEDTEYHIEGINFDYYAVRTLTKDDNIQRRILLNDEQLSLIQNLKNITEDEVKFVVDNINKNGGFGL